jgi:hypothetical protein
VSGPARASTVFITGEKIVLKDDADHGKRRLMYQSNDPSLGASSDPATNGATLQLTNPVTQQQSGVINMPAGKWRCSGGICRYKDSALGAGPVRKAKLRDGVLKIAAKGSQIAYPLIGLGMQSSIGVTVTIGATRLCATFGGDVKTDDPIKGRFIAKAASAPLSCPCTGKLVGGACWFLGENFGEGCDAACNSIGLTCDAATITYVGSDGTDANCQLVLDLLYGFPGSPFPLTFPSAACEAGLGCYGFYVSSFNTVRCASPPTTCSAYGNPGDIRVCACQ